MCEEWLRFLGIRELDAEGRPHGSPQAAKGQH